MKVYLSPYPHHRRARFFTTYLNNKYGYIKWPEPENYTFGEKWMERGEYILNGIYDLIHKFFGRKKRTLNIRIDPYDVWGAHHTFALIAVPMLKKLQEVKHGSPFVEDSDVPDYLKSTADTSIREEGEVDSNYFKRWDYVLNEMIWAFERWADDEEEDKFYTWKDDGKNLKLVDTNEEGLAAWHARRDNGIRLFAKYYGGLWD